MATGGLSILTDPTPHLGRVCVHVCESVASGFHQWPGLQEGF